MQWKHKNDSSTHLEDIARQVDRIGQPQLDAFAFLLDPGRALHLVVLEAAAVAGGRHDDDVLEVGDVNHLHVRVAGRVAGRAVRRERDNLQTMSHCHNLHKYTRGRSIFVRFQVRSCLLMQIEWLAGRSVVFFGRFLEAGVIVGLHTNTHMET